MKELPPSLPLLWEHVKNCTENLHVMYIDTIYICTNPPSPTRFLKISIFTPFPSQPMGIKIERLVDYYFFLLVKFSIKSAPSLFQKRCRHAFTRK